MSEENNTLNEGGGEALPAASETPAKLPKNDAEAAAFEAKPEGEKPEGDAESKKADESAERKKTRTGQYIHKLQTQIAEYREREKERNASQQSGPRNEAPTLEQYNFDNDAYQKAVTDWATGNVADKARREVQRELQQRHEQQIIGAYNQRLNDFMEGHPDFQSVVAPLQTILSDAVQLAILSNPNGPEVAYHIANDDDLAFQFASIQPHLAAAAVERLASRLTAAHQAPQNHTNPKPVSKAPVPVPTVSGRSPTEIPPEKLTDDAWYARELAKRAAK